MGSLVSSHRTSSTPTLSLRFYQINRRRRSHQQNVPQRDKRSSMNRPVLRLQLKQETLERQRIKANGGNIHMVSKGTLRNLARESGIHPDRLFPDDSPTHTSPLRSRSLNSSPNHVHSVRHHSVESRDSMVIVQFVDNGDYDIMDEQHENGYDKLLPRGEFEHLCTCTYGRVTPSGRTGMGVHRSGLRQRHMSDSNDEHFTTLKIQGNGRSPTLVQALSMGELRDRIVQHLPPQRETDYSFMQRSQSTTDLSTSRLDHVSRSNEYLSVPHHKLVQSRSNSHVIEDENEWSLGESIIRTLSRGNLFDIDNPTHESEREIVKQWPGITSKIQKWRQSQQNLHGIIKGSTTVHTEC